MHQAYPEIVAEIKDKKVISAELEAKMKEAYQLFSDDYIQSLGA